MCDLLNVYVPKVLLIKPSKPFHALLPTMGSSLHLYVVDRACHGLRIAHTNDIDVIVIHGAEQCDETLDMALQLKQSMVTKDIPILILTQDKTFSLHMSSLSYCGIHYLNAACLVEQFNQKVQHLSQAYRRAQDNQLNIFEQSELPQILLEKHLIKLRRSSVPVDNYCLLMLEVDCTAVNMFFKDNCRLDETMHDEALKGAIKDTIKRKTDFVLKMQTNKYAVLLPRTRILGAIKVVKMINDLFCAESKSTIEIIDTQSYQLKVGISTVSSKVKTSTDSILALVESALLKAQDSNEFFYIN